MERPLAELCPITVHTSAAALSAAHPGAEELQPKWSLCCYSRGLLVGFPQAAKARETPSKSKAHCVCLRCASSLEQGRAAPVHRLWGGLIPCVHKMVVVSWLLLSPPKERRSSSALGNLSPGWGHGCVQEAPLKPVSDPAALQKGTRLLLALQTLGISGEPRAVTVGFGHN